MPKFTTTTYGSPVEVLKFTENHQSISVTLSDEGITANAEGKKIIPAGTIIGGGFLADRRVKAKKAVDGTIEAEGVLRYDVDVTYGPSGGAAVIFGFVDINKIPTAPTAGQKTALKLITFLP
jgi:hypothetical protein